VVLEVLIGGDGKPCDIQVKKSSDPRFESAAVDAVKRWRWRPGIKRGKPVAVLMNVEVSFRLMN
jgi:periplasmic protein TonB